MFNLMVLSKKVAQTSFGKKTSKCSIFPKIVFLILKFKIFVNFFMGKCLYLYAQNLPIVLTFYDIVNKPGKTEL